MNYKTISSAKTSNFRIIHRFWATCRKLLDKNRLDFKASRLRIRQSDHSPFLVENLSLKLMSFWSQPLNDTNTCIM